MVNRTAPEPLSVQPEWCLRLPLQQQSVLFLAGRGPDGIEKHHDCKAVHVAYRASIFLAAKYGRSLEWGERADTFMSLHIFADGGSWGRAVDGFFSAWDALPAHYVKHLMHGVQILGFKHPDERFRTRWAALYLRFAEELHVNPESETEMDLRLGDWNQKEWVIGVSDKNSARDANDRASQLLRSSCVCVCRDCLRTKTLHPPCVHGCSLLSRETIYDPANVGYGGDGLPPYHAAVTSLKGAHLCSGREAAQYIKEGKEDLYRLNGEWIEGYVHHDAIGWMGITGSVPVGIARLLYSSPESREAQWKQAAGATSPVSSGDVDEASLKCRHCGGAGEYEGTHGRMRDCDCTAGLRERSKQVRS